MKLIVQNGEITVIGHIEKDAPLMDALGLEVISHQRGGHVRPANRPKRMAFRLIRKLFGRFPAVVEWTRHWRGEWIADLAVSDGPILGPFPSRQKAIEAEENWLHQKLTS